MSTSSISSSSSASYPTPPSPSTQNAPSSKAHPANTATANADTATANATVSTAIDTANAAIATAATTTAIAEVRASQDPTTQAGYLSQVMEGDQGSSQTLQQDLQGTTSLGQKTAPISFSEGGVIIEVASSSATSSGSKVAAPTLFQSFKNPNGAPEIMGGTSRSQGGSASKTSASSHGKSSNDDPLGASSTTDTSSSSSGFNVLEEVELIGTLNQKTQNENDLGAVAAHQLETQNTQNKINKRQHNINISVQQQQSPSQSGKAVSTIMNDNGARSFFGMPLLKLPPATNTTTDTITVTLPNGKTRSTVVSYSTNTSNSGSATYTRTTTGARGQTTDVSGDVTENSSTKTMQDGSTISNSEYTKTYTGTRTTAGGKTINEEGSSIYDKEEVTYEGSGPGDQGKLDGSSATSRTLDGVRAYSDPNNDHKTKVKKVEKKGSRTYIDDAEVEAIEAIQDATQALSNLTHQDHRILSGYMNMITLAALHQQ